MTVRIVIDEIPPIVVGDRIEMRLSKQRSRGHRSPPATKTMVEETFEEFVRRSLREYPDAYARLLRAASD